MSLSSPLCQPHRSKDPEGTRQAVLYAAFDEIHRQGFQAASLSNILQVTGLTKGALYHHFTSKQELGYAVLDEVVTPMVVMRWIAPLQGEDIDPIDTMITLIQQAASEISSDDIALGCPLNNLAQEMSPIDEGFRRRICDLFEQWRSTISKALAVGKSQGLVRGNVDEASSAAFIVGALEGCVGMAKNARSREILMQCGQGVLAYLASLKPERAAKR